MDFLVLSDLNGVVDMTHEAIARRTNRPIEIIRSTIAELERPDERSRTPDFKGARIKRLDDHRDWGWMIVNYEQFRKIASSEQKREKTLARVHKHRGIKRCNAVKRTATPKDLCNAMQKQREEVEAEGSGEESRNVTVTLPKSEHSLFVELWMKELPDYAFSGKDASHLKTLLKSSRKTAVELMDVARSAWKVTDPKRGWNCVNRSKSIPNFASAYNEIVNELRDMREKPKTNTSCL